MNESQTQKSSLATADCANFTSIHFQGKYTIDIILDIEAKNFFISSFAPFF